MPARTAVSDSQIQELQHRLEEIPGVLLAEIYVDSKSRIARACLYTDLAADNRSAVAIARSAASELDVIAKKLPVTVVQIPPRLPPREPSAGQFKDATLAVEKLTYDHIRVFGPDHDIIEPIVKEETHYGAVLQERLNQRDVAELVDEASADVLLPAEAVAALRESITELAERAAPQRRAAQLRGLASIAVRVAQLDWIRDQLDSAVTEARTDGATWSDIGRAAQITPQAAKRRWDPEAKRKHRDYQRNRNQAPGDESE